MKMNELNRRSVSSVTRLLVALVAMTAVFTRPAAAEEPDVGAIKISTPVYAPAEGDFAPPFGTYSYEVAWQGIPAAELSVSLKESDGRYRITTSARTYSAIDLFYKLRYRAEGLISALDLTPFKTFIDNRENSRQRLVQMTFHENGDIESVRSQTGKDSKFLRFNTGNFTLDPFSAAFLARSLPWEKGMSREFDTFNGKTRYLITLTAVDQVKMVVNGRNRDVWVISPTVKNLNSPASNSKLREARVYITADPEREVLQIVSKVFIGAVTTKLVSFTPDTTRSPIQMAHNQPQRISFKFF